MMGRQATKRELFVMISLDEYVPEDAVIGVLTGFFRGEKEVDLNGKKYQRYVNKRIKTYPARKRAYKARSFVKHIIKKIVGRK